jgi:hypothetical protein
MKGSFRGSEYPTQAKKAFPPEKADRPNRFLIGWAVVSFVLRSYEAR